MSTSATGTELGVNTIVLTVLAALDAYALVATEWVGMAVDVSVCIIS